MALTIDKDNFEFWLPMQETSGTRYDITGNARNALASTGLGFGGYGAPGYNTGHVQSNSADFERSNVDGLYIPDGSYQSGDRDWTMGGWFYLESDAWILMCQGGENLTSCWCCSVSARYPKIGVGISGSSAGWNDSYQASGTTLLSLSTWYHFFAYTRASENKCWVWVYDTSGNRYSEDSTTLMNFGANNGPAITFGHAGNSSYPLDTPIYGNVGYADGRLEQWFLYDGYLAPDDRDLIVNGGDGATWTDLFGSPGTKFLMGRNFWKNWEGIFRPKTGVLTLPDKAVVAGAL